MNIISIEPTPSPNTMKLTMDEKLASGVQLSFTQETKASAPVYIQKLLEIEGVRSVFHVVDFIALERITTADWQPILAQAREILGGSVDGTSVGNAPSAAADSYGEVQVFVQMFRGIPMQIKLVTGTEQTRQGLPERFAQAALQAGSSSPNLVMERKWEEAGVRYGEPKQIGEEMAQELDAAYDQARLDELVKMAPQLTGEEVTVSRPEPIPVTLATLDNPDWRKRYAALEQMNPTEEDIPVLAKALQDEKSSIRRLAVVYFGMIGGAQVLPYLYEGLKDSSVSVRRTAGDTLSDIGDPQAIPAMIKALGDSNKLVRWRAARFLYETGDETALDALRQAEHDTEFEVALQIKMAIERIEKGEAAAGSVWQQMTNRERG
ncbi:virulence factor [Brevibacillus dissolubilis]|uniref:virulence factor n=1 Tax=Brevibacillus dissolubilis TaxID=1844116 RepID=UPI0011176B51|nr:virulence factor [Brevibacillus dissolubilis]